jgi:hypothetical protein
MLDKILDLESASALREVCGPLGANAGNPGDEEGPLNKRSAETLFLRHQVVLHLVEVRIQLIVPLPPSIVRLQGILRMLCSCMHAEIRIGCA